LGIICHYPFLGWPVEPVAPVEPVGVGKISDFIFLTGKRANGQRAQPLVLEHFESVYNKALEH